MPTGIHFSVSAAMGLIPIFGIAVQDTILVVTYFQRLRELEGMPIPPLVLLAHSWMENRRRRPPPTGSSTRDFNGANLGPGHGPYVDQPT